MEDKLKKELIQTFSERLSQAAKMYLENCSRCGLCVEACHVYASSPETRYTAVARAQNIRRLYEQYFKKGWFGKKLNEAVEFSDEWMAKIEETAYTCTGCRRCMTFCPFGIDTGVIQGIAKMLLITADMEPKTLTMLADMSIAKGKNIEKTKETFSKAVKNLEKEVLERWRSEGGDEVVPLEVQDANVLYVALAGKHSIIPAAAIMNAAREKWTLSYFEAVNFGAFVGNPAKTKDISARIINEAKRLNVKEVVICECGTAYRVMKHMTGEQPFKVITFVQLMARYVREGRIKLDKSRYQGKVITYHDPCQIARQGGIYEEPRELLRAMSDNFVEMTPNRSANWCCGGGGGLVAIGDKDFRMKSAKVKADQAQATGAAILCTACENCHTQLHDLVGHYKLGMEVEYLSNMVAEALLQEGAVPEAPPALASNM
ncbi:MAG: (Fe-S)-binding protein [Deltaproteobacteria bacterium]|nr:(Fe-S)-binding protein [Deltaproteobacteria bacterium]